MGKKGLAVGVIIAIIGIPAAVALYSGRTSLSAEEQQTNARLNNLVDRCFQALESGNSAVVNMCDSDLVEMMETYCVPSGKYDICHQDRSRIDEWYGIN